MKTRHAYTPILAVLLGASVVVAQERVIPSDPGAQSGNTGAAGAHGEAINPNAPRLGDRLPADRVDIHDTGTAGQLPRDDRQEPLVGVGTATGERDEHKSVQKLSKLNQRVTSLSRLATDRASDQQVRGFAEEMVRAHESAAQELALLAARRGASPEARQLDESRDDRENLARKSGRDFDKAYVEEMAKAHEKSIEALEKASQGDDGELAAFANRVLPQVRDHHERVRGLKNNLR